jgi:hypothetical protein
MIYLFRFLSRSRRYSAPPGQIVSSKTSWRDEEGVNMDEGIGRRRLFQAAMGLSVLAGLGAAGTAAAQAMATTGPAALADMLAGRWDNAAQVAAGTDPARPHLHVRHSVIAGDDFNGVPVYAELRVGGPEGEVYRQRVYVLSPAPGGDDIEMAVYELKEPEPFAGADPATLESLGPDTLTRFDPGCDFLWRPTEGGWDGAIEDGACMRTSSRSGRDMIIGAAFTIRDAVFTHAESGRYTDDGAPVFAPPNGEPNLYDRVE